MSQMRNCFISAIFLTVLFVNIHTGLAFRCWFCNSETDPACGDPFNVTSTSRVRHEECNGPGYNNFNQVPANANGRYVCRKVKYHRTNTRDSRELSVHRQCVPEWDNGHDACSQAALGSFMRVEHCSTCDTDLCNSAPTLFKIGSLFGPIVVLLSKIHFM